VTVAVPAVAIAACGIIAVTMAELLTAVVMFDPLKVTNACDPKLVPMTCSEKAGPPAVALAGLKLAIVGAVPAVAMG